MSGICIIIPESDFSGSPIGRVNIIYNNKDIAQRIVDNYSERIGDTQYNNALVALVKGMLDANLWDKTELFWPILGNTLANKCEDLKGRYPLNLLSTASNGDKKITFTPPLSGTDVVDTSNRFNLDAVPNKERSIIIRASSVDAASTLINGLYVARPNLDAPSRSFIVGFQASARLAAESLNGRIAYSQLLGSGGAVQYVNGVLKEWESDYNATNTYIYTYAGAKVNTNLSLAEAFNGDMYYCLYGHYTKSELLQMDQLLSAFEVSVGKVTSTPN